MRDSSRLVDEAFSKWRPMSPRRCDSLAGTSCWLGIDIDAAAFFSGFVPALACVLPA
jgi:hypothetical protein